MDRPLLLLKSHNYFKGLPDEILEDIAEQIRVVTFDTGEIIHESNKPMNDILFVTEGRIKVVLVDSLGLEKFFGFADRGDQLGMITSALSEPLPMRAIAVEPTTLIMLDQEVGFQLSAMHEQLRRHWRTKLAGAMSKHFLSDDRSHKTLIVSCFHNSRQTRHLTNQLIEQLEPHIDGKIGLVTDYEQATIPENSIAYRVEKKEQVDLEPLFQKLGEWRETAIIFIDLDASVDIDTATRVCSLSQKVVWWLDLGERQASIEKIESLVTRGKGFTDKLCAAWWLDQEICSPMDSRLNELVDRQFKISARKLQDDDNLTFRVNEGIVRLANFLRGIQVGLALGGGAARGMAHLGVLKALENAGIAIDRIAGTSAGAMVGSLYGYGLSADFMDKQFAIDLRPPGVLRTMPRGKYWYLFYKYRAGKFGPMLRKYIGTVDLEQLQIPCSTVTVDLVRGEAVVRQSGEAVNSILESINLPFLSYPMIQNDTALIDGGFVNNVPADVLVEQGCNIVIAVDVLSKMEQEFLKIRPGEAPSKNVRPNFLQTYLRIYAIQNAKLTAAGANAADITIQPDVSAYSLADFMKAEAMADIGQATANEHIEQIQNLVDSLEKRLRRSPANLGQLD